MKKLISIALVSFVLLATACSNSTDSTTTKDTVNVDVNTSVKDTSSYERMPNK